MMELAPRLWKFVGDMNYDGSMTISDVSLWLKWLFFYPGDIILVFFIKEFPELMQFLELGPENYGGILSGVLSAFSWIFIFLILYGAWSVITDILAFFSRIILRR